VLGCGGGEKVLVAKGAVAANWFSGKSPPVDALIIGSVEVTQGPPPRVKPGSSGRRTVMRGEQK